MDPHQERDGTSDVAESFLEETDKKPDNTDYDFTTKTWKEDFCIIVEDKRLYVAKLILALASPVFERMFQAEFKEKGETEMTLPGKKFEEVQEFLRCIYPGVKKDVTINNAHKIVALAEEYQVAVLKSKCEACLLIDTNEKTSAERLCELLNLACLYSLQDLFHKCTTMAAEMPLATIDEAADEKQIPLNVKNIIQRKIILKMEETNTETNLTVDKLKAELQTVTTLNNYHRTFTPEKKRLSLDDYEGWNGTSLFLKIDAKKSSNSFTAQIGRTQINVGFEIPQNGGLVCLTLAAPSQIKFKGSVVITNGTKGKNNFCRRIQNKLCQKSISLNIDIDIDDLKEEGFIHHGKIDVEIHILGK